MDFSHVNWVAVAAAAVAAFAFGAAYYTLLGKHWMDAAGLSADDLGRRSPAPFVTSFAGLLVMATVLSGVSKFGPDPMPVSHAIQAVLVLWVGFVVTTIATNNAFQQARPKLTAIDSGHWLGVLVVQALVISAF